MECQRTQSPQQKEKVPIFGKARKRSGEEESVSHTLGKILEALIVRHIGGG